MKTLLSETPRRDYLLLWVHPKLIEFVEDLPRYGTGLLHMQHGMPTENWHSDESHRFRYQEPREADHDE
jgi:hypothetical protein